MGQNLSESAVGIAAARWIALLGLVSALAAMALPTGTGYTPEIASVLAVGALAMLAGHAWGLLVVVLADVMLIGKVWPLVFLDGGDTSTTVVAGGVALAAALPGALLLSRTLPRTVEIVLGRTDSPWRATGVYGSSVLVAIWLVLPIF